MVFTGNNFQHVSSCLLGLLGLIKSVKGLVALTTLTYTNNIKNLSRSHFLVQNEIGVHRVQRVPATEAMGRLHTSTMSVAVLPEPEEVNN